MLQKKKSWNISAEFQQLGLFEISEDMVILAVIFSKSQQLWLKIW